jgi:uncharacterized metal-binding protein YceD (DUF177 family)
MALLVNLLHIARHSVILKGELPVEALDYGVNDEMVKANSPLEYRLEAEKMEDAVLVQGGLMLKLDCKCVRCLKEFVYKLELTSWACHLPLSGEDAVPIVNDCVDLTPHIREDTLLGFPQHPVCKAECGGLNTGTHGNPADLKESQQVLPSSAWSELDKLKLK